MLVVQAVHFRCTTMGILMNLTVEIEREDDGRWIAEVPQLPGVLAYGQSREEAIARAQALALRVIAERLEHGEATPGIETVFSVAV
jgi:predicted RNase H-like HicB family nuclease